MVLGQAAVFNTVIRWFESNSPRKQRKLRWREVASFLARAPDYKSGGRRCKSYSLRLPCVERYSCRGDCWGSSPHTWIATRRAELMYLWRPMGFESSCVDMKAAPLHERWVTQVILGKLELMPTIVIG